MIAPENIKLSLRVPSSRATSIDKLKSCEDIGLVTVSPLITSNVNQIKTDIKASLQMELCFLKIASCVYDLWLQRPAAQI